MVQVDSVAPPAKSSPLPFLAGQSFLAGFTLSLLYAAAYTRFLVDYNPDFLPHVYVVSAFFIPALSLLYNRVGTAASARRQLIGTTLLICAIYLGSWLLARSGSMRWVSFGLLVLFNALFVFQVVIVTQQAARLFDIRQMKTTYPLVLAAQTGAVIFGGLSVSLLTNLLGGVVNLLLVCLVLSGLQFAVTWLTMRTFDAPFAQRGYVDERAGLRELWSRPYPRHIFLYRFFSGFGTELIIIIFTIEAAKRFQTADALAAFFGNFMAAGTFLTLLFLLLAAGWLLRRFGLGFGIMSNPLFAGAVIIGLFLSRTLAPEWTLLLFVLAVSARVLDFVFSVSITEPSMKTMYQALPEQNRAALITSVEAISQPLGYGVVGGTLLLLSFFDFNSDQLIYGYTLVVCLVWTYYGWRTYRLYTSTLLHKLRRRAVPEMKLEMNDPETRAVVYQLARSDNPRQVEMALELLADVAESEMGDLLQDLVGSPDEAVRLVALQKMENAAEFVPAEQLLAIVNSEESTAVRAAALRAGLAAGDERFLEKADELVDATETALQEAALIGLLRYGGLAGLVAAGQRLLALAESNTVPDQLLLAGTLAGLEQHNFHQPLAALLRSEALVVRIAALQAAERVRHPDLLPLILPLLDAPQTRSAAANTLTAYGPALLPLLETALADETMPLRQRAALIRLSGRWADGRVQSLLLVFLHNAPAGLRMVTLSALLRSGFRAQGADIPLVEVAILAEMARAAKLSGAAAALASQPAYNRLAAALQQELASTVRRLLLLYAFLYEENALQRVEQYLQRGSVAEKAQVLESIDLIFNREHKKQLLPLLDHDLTAAQRAEALGRVVPVPELTHDEWVEQIILDERGQFGDWLCACAILGATQSGVTLWRAIIAEAAQRQRWAAQRPLAAETAEWSLQKKQGDLLMLTIEKVAILQETDIFRNVPAAVLTAVAQIVQRIDLPAEKQFIRDGDPANEMYIIVDGEVAVRKGGTHLITLRPGDVVGELALFDHAPRAADVYTIAPTTLLQLQQETLEDVMADRPEISSGVIRTLVQRIRAQGEQLA